MGVLVSLGEYRDSPTMAAIRRRMDRNTARIAAYERAGNREAMRRAMHRHVALCRQLHDAELAQARALGRLGPPRGH